ncbi:DEAD/DEAH box helicase, partial [bacterium]
KGGDLPFRILLAYGGVDYAKQREEIRQGVDLLIGTPGRLIDYLKQRVYHLGAVEIAVIDEADRMFDMGFIADIRFLLKRMSKYDERQSMLFSATLSDRVMELSYEYMNVPELVEVSPDKIVADRVTQALYHLGSTEKMPFLFGLLKTGEIKKAVVFVNTKHMAERLARALNHNGYPTAVLSGDVPQNGRLKVIRRFSAGEIKILVATDVASRGLHIEDVSHVINYDLPQDTEDYVHRIGRTARAGKSGSAITLACEDYVFTLPAIEEYIGHQIPVGEVKPEMFAEFEEPPREKRQFNPNNRGGGRDNRGGRGGRSGGPQNRQRSGRGSPRGR